ncbi:MAG: AsmA-like C-terminal region-containing protein, partial [Myxococcota bacterium]
SNVTLTRKAPGGERPFIKMKTARIHVRPIPILWGRFAINQIVLDEPELYLVRGPDGKMNLPSPPELSDEDKDKREKAGSPDIGGRIFLTRTKLTRGRATLIDQSKGSKPVTTKIENFDLEMKDLAFGREPEFKLRAVTGNGSGGSQIDLEGRLGKLERGMAPGAIALDVKLKSRNFDFARFQPYLPESWQRRVRGGVLDSDLAISGSFDAGLDVEGDIRVEQADFGDSYKLTGTIAGEIDLRGEDGVTRGKADLTLAPGRFTKGDLDIDGETRIQSDFRGGGGKFRAEIDIDATKARYRQGDVFTKKQGATLTLAGVLEKVADGLEVSDARGRVGDLPFRASAEIGRPAGPGRSTPYALHFSPGALDLASVAELIEDTAPFALGGQAIISRLDMLRRPEEAREYQVTIDARLSNVSARFPLDDGRAHIVRDLTGDIAITPGLLTVPGASATVNGAPVEFEGRVEEFMAMLSSDPARRRANVHVEAWKDSIDLDQLLEPAGAGPGPREAEEGPGRSAWAQAPEGTGAPRERFVERFFVKEGSIRADRAIYAEQPLTDLRAGFTYYEPVLTLLKTEFKQAEGDWSVSGTLSLNGTTTFDLAVGVADARVESLAKAFSKSDKPSRIFGILNGKVELHGQGSDLEAWQKTLRGSGDLVVRDGRLPGFNIYEVVIQAVLGVFARIVPIGKLSSFSEENTFEVFEQTFRIDRGRIWSEDIRLETVDYDLKGKGSAGLDQSLDYNTVVELTTAGTQKMVSVASLPLLKTSTGKISPVPVRITGTAEEPTIVPDASVISVGTLGALVKGVTGGGAAIVKGGLKGILGG